MNRWIALGLLAATAVGAQPRGNAAECEDAYLECKEDCTIRWGGTTDLKKRQKNHLCINKCASIDRDCREAFLETKRNNLDEGSLKGSPSSRDVDGDGIPTKTAQKKPPPPPKDDDVRDDAPKKEEKPAPAKPEIAAEETPKSNRTTLKTDSKDKPAEPKPEAKPEPKPEPSKPEVKETKTSAPVREEPPPRREEPKREEPPREEAPPPKKEKKEEKRDEKKKERALDEWDPDAF